MALILCIETSARSCSVALAEGGSCIATKEAIGDFQHSKQITLLIQACLAEKTKSIIDLDAVAVSQGPGSYTGLRVGLSCAKGICYARKIPLIGLDTLNLIAYPFVLTKEELKDTLIVPMIDARRSEVYYKILNRELQDINVVDNLVLDEDSFKTYQGQKLLFCGDGAHKMNTLIKDSVWAVHESIAHAKNMAYLAENQYSLKEFEDLAYFTPFYFKPPNITKSKKQLF